MNFPNFGDGGRGHLAPNRFGVYSGGRDSIQMS